jgi:hypothetical protein
MDIGVIPFRDKTMWHVMCGWETVGETMGEDYLCDFWFPPCLENMGASKKGTPKKCIKQQFIEVF